LNLVILDVALAEADGLELLARLKGVHPKLPIIILQAWDLMMSSCRSIAKGSIGLRE